MAVNRISDEAVEDATGRSWSSWFETLDAWGGTEAGHAEIAGHLADEHDLSPWWSQMVAVRYERERGLREVGQTAGGRFQVGTQRTVALEPEAAWQRVFGADGLAMWLGEGAPEGLAEGDAFELEAGTWVEVRVLEPGSHARLRWRPAGWDDPSTVQVRVDGTSSGKAAVRFHHEGLPDASTREVMRAHWKRALEALFPDA